MWGAGGTNPQAWAELLRMWGVQPDSEKEKWRDAFRDMKRGQVPWGSMNEVSTDPSLPWSALLKSCLSRQGSCLWL